jgi:putative SOS response-associated peptidase YedK
MCYHYSLTKEKVDLEERFDATLEYEWVTQYHVSGFSGKQLPIITTDNPKIIQPVSWGLIPFWVKTNQQAKELRLQTLNAMSETVFDKPSFRGSIGKKRCLVLADGIFEWQTNGKEKTPHYISLKNHEAFAMAGIYDTWIDKETGEEIKTYSILTCDANPLMEKIHNTKKRMPVILPREVEKHWLDVNLKKEEIQSLMTQYPEDNMQAWTISKLITSRTENSNVPEVLQKLEN